MTQPDPSGPPDPGVQGGGDPRMTRHNRPPRPPDLRERLQALKHKIEILENSLMDGSGGSDPLQAARDLEDLEQQAEGLCPLIEGQEDFFRLIIEEVSDVVVLCDERAHILYVNPVVEELLGYAPAEILGRNVRILMPPAEQGAHDKYVREYGAGGPAHIIGVGRDVLCRTRDGALLPFELRITEVWVRERQYYIGTLRDIRRRKGAEEKAREATLKAVRANKAKSEFLANMSHELRTPLNAIIGYSEMLQQQFFGSLGHEKYLEYAGFIRTSGNRLLDLVNDVLDLSKVEAGRYDVIRDHADLERLVGDICHEFTPMAEAAQVRLVISNPEKVGQVFVDEKAVKQILANLISNAIKFSFPDTAIELDLRRVGEDRLSLVVRDCGIGMSVRDIGIAMTSFGQVQSSQIRTHQGTGLGLPLTQSLVRLHDGDFSLESVPGRGTAAKVILPICEDRKLL